MPKQIYATKQTATQYERVKQRREEGFTETLHSDEIAARKAVIDETFDHVLQAINGCEELTDPEPVENEA